LAVAAEEAAPAPAAAAERVQGEMHELQAEQVEGEVPVPAVATAGLPAENAAWAAAEAPLAAAAVEAAEAAIVAEEAGPAAAASLPSAEEAVPAAAAAQLKFKAIQTLARFGVSVDVGMQDEDLVMLVRSVVDRMAGHL
jgi:hypothetical protein